MNKIDRQKSVLNSFSKSLSPFYANMYFQGFNLKNITK